MLKIKLTGANSKVPVRMGAGAGFDLFACDQGTIRGLSTASIPLGIASAFPEGYVCLLMGRSSLASKGIYPLGGVIDCDYRGEWRALMTNVSTKPYDYKVGDRICQFIFQQVWTDQPIIVENLDDTVRAAGGFGSTGR